MELSSWIVFAFALGMLARPLGLPPLVGYLAAGFTLAVLGETGDDTLAAIAHYGVLLLLFTVGLKLRLRNFLQPENWGGGTIHLFLTCLLFAPSLYYTGHMDLGTSVLVAVAFGFSSTVIAAKILEERRELRAFHGRVAVGILVFQDVIAVAMIAYVAGAAPSPWVLALAALPLARPLLHRLLHLSGHDELLVLCGLLLAIVAGGHGFGAVGLSPELGALVLGALLADHPKAKELADSLWALKEVFLVGFFLQIGMAGAPDLRAAVYAVVLVMALPLKALLFFVIMLHFGLRARSSFLASLSLATYSEFGLIVTDLAVRHGLLAPDWLSLFAIAVALSFALAAPVNRYAHALFERYAPVLESLESKRRHPDDEPVSLGQAHILIMGMGRIGTGAYDFLSARGERVVGLDSDPGKVARQLAQHRRVLYADAEDPGFWGRLEIGEIDAVLLALPDPQANQIAALHLRRRGFGGPIGAAARHKDEEAAIVDAGADMTFNVYDEAGVGFAEHVWERLHERRNGPVVEPT